MGKNLEFVLMGGYALNMPEIIGKSPAIRRLKDFIKQAAQCYSNVLILGETGVGKELAAEAIHLQSDRKDCPFVKINCGNLNENLCESELFGHRKGAFTGAIIDKPGLIETANHGTFFFDEIGNIGFSIQAKLLSVIEDKSIRRIGEHNGRNIDVRFIFATNKDLPGMLAKQQFRDDLYYRISVLVFKISPLRERPEDIPLLADALLAKANRNGDGTLAISNAAKKKLCNYSYPGNIRELENAILRASIVASNKCIEETDLQFPTVHTHKSIKKSRYRIHEIIEVLLRCEGNKTKAAKELRMSREHLYRLINRDKNDS